MREYSKFVELINSLSKIIDADINQIQDALNSTFEALSEILNAKEIELLLSESHYYQTISSNNFHKKLIDDSIKQLFIDIFKQNNFEIVYIDPQLNLGLYSISDEIKSVFPTYLAPIIDNGSLIGIIKISFDGENYALDNKDKTIIQSICSILAKIFNGINHFPNILNNNQLRAANNIFQGIIDYSQNGILIVNYEGTIVYSNESVVNIFGLDKENIIGQSYINIRFSLEPINRNNSTNYNKFKSSFNDALTKGQSDILNRQIECNIINAKNEIKFITEFNYIVTNNSEQFFVSVIQDITELKQTEQALIESEQRYKLIADNSKDLIIKHSRNGTINYISPSCFNLTGYLQEELLYENLFDKLFDSKSVKIKETIAKLSDNHPISTIVSKVNTKYSGKYLWCEITSSLIEKLDENHSDEIITVIHDITERINILDELDRSISLLSSAIESTADGMIITDREGNILIHNKIFEKIWDISGDYISTHTEKEIYLKIVSKIQANKYLKKQIIQIARDSENEFYEILRQKNGTVIEVYSKPMKIGQDKIGRIWTFRDLTKRTEAETALRNTYIQLKSLISAIPDMIYFKDTSNKFIFVNKAFINWLGIDEDKIIGKTDDELENYSKIKQLVKNDNSILNSKQVNKEIIKYQYKNQPFHYFEIIKSPIMNENNEANGLLCLIKDITAQKIANETLRESEERFRNIFETSSEGICIINENNTIVLANNSFANMLGFSDPNSLIGHDIRDFIDKTWYQRYKEKITALKANQTNRLDFKYKKVDGSELWVFDSSSPLFDQKGKFIGHLAMLTDITERYQTIELLFKQKLLFESIALAVNKLITTSEHKNAILESMDIFSKTLGAGKITIFKIINPDEPIEFQEFIKWKSENFECPTTLEILYQEVTSNPDLLSELKNGRIIILNSKDSIFKNIDFEALLFYTPIIIKDKLWGFTEYICCIIDEQILEQQKSLLLTYNSSLISTIEQMLLYENLNEAIEKAEAANKAKSLFLANISHEIRTPMTAIIGFTELLLSKTDNPQFAKYLNTILKSSNHLLALFNDILDLSKIEAGKIEIKYKPLNIKRIILEIEQIFSQKIHEKNLVFIIDISEDFPEKIYLDEIRLRQILFNLVGNSVKFTNNGFIKITVEPISISNLKLDFIISVQDTGIGIPKELQQSIFESFSKKHTSGKYSFSGSGLGLAITKKLVEKMNGNIEVHSDGITGTKFDIIFRNIEFIEKIKLSEQRSNKISDYEILKERIVILGSIEERIKKFFDKYELINIDKTSPKDICVVINHINPKLIIIDIENFSRDEIINLINLFRELQDYPFLLFAEHIDNELKMQLNEAHLNNTNLISKSVNPDEIVIKINQILKTNRKEISKIQNIQFFEQLQKLEIRDFIRFKDKIENSILPLIKLLNSTLIIDDIYYLASELKALSSKFGISFLEQICKELAENAESYNVENLKKQLSELMNILKVIVDFEIKDKK